MHMHWFYNIQNIINGQIKEILKDACFKGSKCLDVGSGTGYLTLALAKLLEINKGTCYGIEHIPELVQNSIINIKKSHYDWLVSKRVQIYEGEGRFGLPEYAPFDVIHVGAGVTHVNQIPKALLDQLKPGGRMLIPIGLQNDQQFVSIDKDIFGNLNLKGALGVCFVPLTSKYDQLNQNK